MKALPIGLLFIALSLARAQVNYCPNFEMPVLGKDLVYSLYRNAAVRIVSGDQVGTGYLIDAQRGYVITAGHVVQPSLDDKTIPITATNETNAAAVENKSQSLKPFSLIPISDLRAQNIDVALLQLVPPDAMRYTNALDIALRIPLNSRPSFVFGYPREQSHLSQQTAENTNDNPDGTLTVKHAAFPGDSGSPLIDETGKVVATCVERVLTQEQHVSNEAIYIPTAAILDLLDKIPVTTRVAGIDHILRTQELSRDELVEDLMPVPDPQHLSNLELYSWAYHLWKEPSTKIESEFFPCPILRALGHRKLEEAEDRLQGEVLRRVR